jgi:CHAD domain-containing protein
MPEREVKLGVPVGFELPELGGRDDGFLAEPQAPRRYRTTYYDTPDLRLARWGSWLRHRSDEGWTVKLPAEVDGPLLVRGEHAFPGDGRRPPEEAVDLVRAFVRGGQLAPVARLRTLRRPVELRGQAGERLAEIVDDEVQVLDGSRIADRFREVEVELAEGVATGLLDRVVARLRRAGAGEPDPTPRYLRALRGLTAGLPGPELVVPEPGKDQSVGELLRHELAGSTLRLLRHDAAVRLGEDPEAVHQARVATRRIRSTLRTFSSLLEPGWTGGLRGELRWLAGLLGAVRDADVLLQRFRADLAAVPTEDAALGPGLLEGLEGQREAVHDLLLSEMAGRRYTTLLDDLVAAAASPALLPGADRPAAEALPPLVAEPWRKLAKAVRAAGRQPGDAELHQIRIRAKRVRYAAEAIAPAVGRRAVRFAKAAEALQEVLGEQHDAVVAEAWLRNAARSARRGAALVAGQLIVAERAKADAGRATWRKAWKALDRKPLRAWLPGAAQPPRRSRSTSSSGTSSSESAARLTDSSLGSDEGGSGSPARIARSTRTQRR